MEKGKTLPRTAWLTLNRECNFRCPWCYAKGTAYLKKHDMPHDLSLRLVDFCEEAGIQLLALIGGEPTLWPKLIDLIEHISARSMESLLITNGSRLSDSAFSARLDESHLTSIAISLKAANSADHLKFTRDDRFDLVLEGARNAARYKKELIVSVTLNRNTKDIVEYAKIVSDIGAKLLSIDFCSVTFRQGRAQKGFMLDPKDCISLVLRDFERINDIMNGGVYINQSMPYCLWPRDFINDLLRRGQLGFGCSILGQGGIVFDQSGNLLICNCMHEFPLARFGVEFEDSETFRRFWQNHSTRKVYQKLSSYPHESCLSCDRYAVCAGGCPLLWFLFDPREIISHERSSRNEKAPLTTG